MAGSPVTTVRPMDLARDLVAVQALQEETYCTNFERFRFGPEFLCEFSRQLRYASRSQQESLLVADADRRVVGFLWMGIVCAEFDSEPVQATVRNLSVARDQRRRGIGRQLMGHGEMWAEQRGASRLTLQVTASNDAAIALYRTLGYEVERYEMAKPLR